MQKVQEGGGEKFSSSWGGASSKALGAMEKFIKFKLSILKPAAASLRTLVEGRLMSRLYPLLEKGRAMIDKVGSLDVNSFVMGRLDAVMCVVKEQLSELFEVEEVGLTRLAEPVHILAALDHVSAAARGVMGRFRRWEGALKALAQGFKGHTWEGMREVLAAAGLTGALEQVVHAVTATIRFLSEDGVADAVEGYAQVGAGGAREGFAG